MKELKDVLTIENFEETYKFINERAQKEIDNNENSAIPVVSVLKESPSFVNIIIPTLEKYLQLSLKLTVRAAYSSGMDLGFALAQLVKQKEEVKEELENQYGS